MNATVLDDLKSRPISTYIDIFEPMLNPQGRPRPDLYAEDGLHLSPEGYRVWTAEILKYRMFLFG